MVENHWSYGGSRILDPLAVGHEEIIHMVENNSHGLSEDEIRDTVDFDSLYNKLKERIVASCSCIQMTLQKKAGTRECK